MRFIDLHCDTIGECVARSGGSVSLLENNCHIDARKLQKGDALAQFFAIFIPTHAQAESAGLTLSPYDYFQTAYKMYLEQM